MIDYPNNPSEGQYFVDGNEVAWIYENSIWQKSNSGDILSIGQLTDVTNDNAQQHDALKYDGADFVNTTLPTPNYPSDQHNIVPNRYVFHTTNTVEFKGYSGGTRLGYYGYGASGVVFDPNNMVDIVNRRINIPVTGYWRIILRSLVEARETDTAGYIWVNGAIRSCMYHNYPSYGNRVFGDEYYIGNQDNVLLLNSGDYIEARFATYAAPSGGGYYQPYLDSEFSGFLMRQT